MIEVILFIGLIGVFVYIQNVSSRLAKLESLLQGRQAAQPVPAPSPVQVVDAGVVKPVQTAPLPPRPPVPSPQVSMGVMHAPVSEISPVQWVAGVGVIALLFGLAFFFKYAIDQGWVTEWMRIILGLVVGSLFIALGELWKRKYAKYALVLTGGGLALLYFTVFAAYNYYHKLDQPFAFLCTIIITLAGIGLSYRYNSKVLGLLAVVGAYLSPLLVGSGKASQIGLFAYLTIVNIGVLLMLLKRYWSELLFVALVGTGFVFSIWAGQYSNQGNVGASVAFLVFNYLLVALLTATIFRKFHEMKQLPENTDSYLGAFYGMFGVALFAAVAGFLYDGHEGYIAPVMLLLAVITFLSYTVLDRLEYVKVNYPLSLVGSKFLVASIMWQFSGAAENAYLLAAASLGLGVGFLVKRKDLRVWGLILLLITVVKIVVSGQSEGAAFLINSHFLLEVLSAILLIGWGMMYSKQKVDSDELQVPTIMSAAAAAVVWFGVSQEIVTLFSSAGQENTRNLSLSIWWMCYAVVLTIVGSFERMHVFRKVAVVLFGITVLKVFLYDVQALELGYRVVSFILLGVILLGVAFTYQKNKDKLQKFWEGDEPTHVPNS